MSTSGSSLTSGSEGSTGPADSNSECSGNPQIAIQMEGTVPSASTLNTLFKLIENTKGTNIETQKAAILKIIESNPGICAQNKENKNIFHCLALNDERNEALLSLFGFCNPNQPDSYTNFVPANCLEELLKMPHTSRKMYSIHYAVQNGFFLFVKEVLKKCPDLVTCTDGKGRTPLHIAAESSMPESFKCTEVLLEAMSSPQQTMLVFCTKSISLQETPVHTICSNVSKNECKASERLRLMLNKASSEWSDNLFSRDVLDAPNSNGMTPLHLLCNGKDEQATTNGHSSQNGNSSQDVPPKLIPIPIGMKEMRNRYKLAKTLLEFLDSRGVSKLTEGNFRDQCSALHLAVQYEFPAMVALLLEKHAVVLMTLKDKNQKTALHYAAQYATRPGRQACLKLLVDWNKLKTQFASNIDILEPQDYLRKLLLLDSVEELIDGIKVEHTPLTFACVAKSTQSVDFMLKNMFYAKPRMEDWFISEESKQRIHSLKAVYEHTPGALEFLFTKSISINMKTSDENIVEFNIDMSIITALHSPVQQEEDLIATQYLGYAENWPNNVQQKLLLHPLTHCALGTVWKTDLRIYKMLFLFFKMVWLLLWFFMIPIRIKCVSMNKNSTDIITNITNTTDSECFPFGENKDEITDNIDLRYHFSYLQKAASCVLLIWTLVYVLSEILVTKCFRKDVLPVRERIFDIVHVILTLITVSIPCFQTFETFMDIRPIYFIIICCVMGILTVCIDTFRNLGVLYLPLGKTVEYSISAILEMVWLMFIFSSIILGFTLSYQQLSPKDFPEWYGSWAFVKVLVKMTGEFDYTVITDAVTNIFFLSFWLFAVCCMSLIIAIIYDKIKDKKTKLDMSGMCNHIRLTNYIQRTLVCKIQLIIDCFKSSTSASDQTLSPTKVPWFLERNVEHNWWSGFLCSFCKCCDRRVNHVENDTVKTLCGNGLPKVVKAKIFEMYDEKLREQLDRYKAVEKEEE